MNKTILITGANAGIGKETARQLALKKETEKIYLGCRNRQKAEAAKKELEEATGKKIFEILIIDVSSIESVNNAVETLAQPIDALVMNAGGMGGKTPEKLTKEGVMQITATNLLGHVVLLERLIETKKLKNMALLASSEVARGVKKMGIKSPDLKSYSVEELKAVLNGEAYKSKFDNMQVYGMVKFVGTLWLSHLAKKHPQLKLISMSPGGTRGTEGFKDMPFLQRFFYQYIGMPLIMPMLGLSHSLQSGAKRFADALSNSKLQSGKFYASKANVLTGPIVEQGNIFPPLNNAQYQENAYSAIHKFI